MKSKSPRSSQPISNLSEAILASGLIKNPKLLNLSETQNSEEISIKNKKGNINRPPSFVDNQIRSISQLKPSNLEEIVLDRQLNAPLPKLRQEPPISKMKPTINDINSYSIDGPNLTDSIFSSYFTPEIINPSNLQILENLDNDKPITFPQTAFAIQNLSKNQIATRANYEGLLNLLHQLTVQFDSDFSLPKSIRLFSQKDSYDTIMSEIVKQGFIECSTKGELLQTIRNYLNEVTNQIIVQHDKIQKQQENFQTSINELNNKNETIQKDNFRLQSDNNVLIKRDIELITRIKYLEDKIPLIEEENKKMRQKVHNLDNQLTETSKLLKESEIKVSDSLKKALDNELIVDNLNKDYIMAIAELKQLRIQYNILLDEKEQLQLNFEKLNNLLEKSYLNEKFYKEELDKFSKFQLSNTNKKI